MDSQDIRPLAVITGGSNGIGYELAKQFAEHDYDLLIAAEDPAHLAEAAQSLQAAGAQSVQTCAVDLATEGGVKQLYQDIQALGRPVDVLCVNAGVGLGGPFVETDLEKELRMINLNITGSVALTKYVLKDMVQRDKGKILFTSSIAATMPDPFEAVYGGTKVFLRWFGEALRNELKDTGVGVTVLMPSVTDTNFFERAEMMDTKAGQMENKDDPAMVAKAAFDGLMADKDRVIPSLKNKAMAATAEMLSDTAAAQVHRGLSEPGSGKH
ncbi:SDR family NAD(P)-dependent oxidoreductase [Phenylobacterium deserti]|uniref:Oxidoreductase n=1 Tax=Phenylobacterium deserti TaxID=1914756 RepID=A0A328ANF0_9CAUL|nr:SDR family NAD(P)-dependent oxidoreductase [Phenylobacterium deserti]RAK56542.1 oxidoreductase [Phenylobacterium deserti]